MANNMREVITHVPENFIEMVMTQIFEMMKKKKIAPSVAKRWVIIKKADTSWAQPIKFQ